jgi:hypothetical protein
MAGSPGPSRPDSGTVESERQKRERCSSLRSVEKGQSSARSKSLLAISGNSVDAALNNILVE